MPEVKNETVTAQHAMIGNSERTPAEAFMRTTHPDAQWFPEAGMGLFLHMGIASVRGECDLSWGMIKNEGWTRKLAVEKYGLFNSSISMTPNDYWAMAPRFTADNFDAEKILCAAKKAGMKYAILTTKHHDGFCLWPSNYGDFHIGKYQPGRDLVREFIEGCRKTGIKAGLYYSPPDWHFNRNRMSFHYGNLQPPLNVNHQPIVLPESVTVRASEGGRPAYLPTLSPDDNARMDREFNDLVRGHVRELLGNYGKVDIIWFDGLFPEREDTLTIDEMRAMQPGILCNPRALGYGDFVTAECAFPKQRHESWWEFCHVGYDGGWGYRDHDSYKPAGWVLSELVKTRSWGGNFLLNYGPDSRGEMPAVYYKRMAQIEQWMLRHEESVLGGEAVSSSEQSDVPVTGKGKIRYVHFDYINEGEATLRMVTEPKRVTLLADGSSVPHAFADGCLKIMLPARVRTTLVDVVKVEF